MPRIIEKNAKSKEEALKLAAEEFGVPVSELSYEVEREVGKGLMGLLLGKEVIISAWITKEAEEEERIKNMAKERALSDKIEKEGHNPYAPKTEPQAHDYASEERKNAKKVDSKKEINENKPIKAETQVNAGQPDAETVKNTSSAANKNREVTEKSLEDAKYFASELIHKIGLEDAVVDVSNGGGYINVDVSGSKMGLLIGKRGDTLDAVQYLTSLYVNKAKNSYIKVNIDTENYRSKREETLVKLARSLERRVIRESNAVTLEPMSPNERRIIHSALQNSSKVKTYSIGEEPNRKLVVALK